MFHIISPVAFKMLKNYIYQCGENKFPSKNESDRDVHTHIDRQAGYYLSTLGIRASSTDRISFIFHIQTFKEMHKHHKTVCYPVADLGFRRGGQPQKCSANLLFGIIFDENCMKV